MKEYKRLEIEKQEFSEEVPERDGADFNDSMFRCVEWPSEAARIDEKAKAAFVEGAEKAIREGRMVEDWDGTWRELPEHVVKAYKDAGLPMGDPREVNLNAGTCEES